MSVDVATQARARLRLLGGFQLLDAHGMPIQLTSRRARGLLALVYLEGDAGLARDRACGLLWSDRRKTRRGPAFGSVSSN